MSVAPNLYPFRSLAAVFVAYKAFLFAIAAGSRVGPTYDTSSSILAPDASPGLITRLTSWDAIYFVQAALRGFLFEQDWAFGSALPTCISLVVRALPSRASHPHLESLVGIVISSLCHFGSALVLYQLGAQVWADNRWALVAALLHVLSPAGLFLSAPYAESAFSLLSFSGWLLLAKSCVKTSTSGSVMSRDALTILAAASFGIATWFRTNGLLNGAPIAFDFLATLYHLVEDIGGRKPNLHCHIRRLLLLAIAGLLVASGFIIPQFLAYKTYCSPMSADPRPWCAHLIPSIYDFVQRQYWDNGFLRYWTLSNAPLFALAAPMLFVMGKSANDALLVGAALAYHHVQIITRLSSAYPVWYWWLADCLSSPKTTGMGSRLVVFIIMYASIQAVLFASFLPPA